MVSVSLNSKVQMCVYMVLVVCVCVWFKL